MTSEQEKKLGLTNSNIPEDMESYLSEKLRTVTRGAKIRLGVWLTILPCLALCFLYFVFWADGFLQYPSWFGQWTQEAVYRNLPNYLDTIEKQALVSSGKSARKARKEALRAISKARRNSQNVGRRWSTAVVKKSDENIGLLIDDIIDKQRAPLKKYLETPDDDSAQKILAQLLDTEIQQFTENLIKEEPRWRAVDMLVATSNKIKELETNEIPSYEEELEAHLLVLLAAFLETN